MSMFLFFLKDDAFFLPAQPIHTRTSFASCTPREDASLCACVFSLSAAILNSATMNIFMLIVRCVIEIISETANAIFGRKLKDVKNKVVLISGTARGLGRELAIQFSKLGSIVLCVDINTTGNEETLKLLENDKGRAYTCDVSDYKSVVDLHEKVMKDVGHVDILLNNAGIITVVPFEKSTPDILKKTVDVNILSQIWMIKVFIQDMIARNCGQIVAISSIGGIIPCRDLVVYAATKHAVVGLMTSLAYELGSNGKDIKFTTVCPYFFNSEVEQVFLPKEYPIVQVMSVPYTVQEIIKGIRQELSIFTIHRWMYLSYYLKFLPSKVQYLLCDYMINFYKFNFTNEDYAKWKKFYQFQD